MSGTVKEATGRARVQSGLYAFTEEDGLEMENGGSWSALTVELSADTMILHRTDGGVLRFRRVRDVAGNETPTAGARRDGSPQAPAAGEQFGTLAGLWASPAGLVAGFAPSGRFVWFVPGRTLQGTFRVEGKKIVLQAGRGPITYGWSRHADRLFLTDEEGNVLELARVALAWGRCPCDVEGRAFVGRTGERLRFGEKDVMELTSSDGVSVRGRYAFSEGELLVTGIEGFPRMVACTGGGTLFLKNGGRLFIFLPAGNAGTIPGKSRHPQMPFEGSLRGKWKAQDGSYWAFFNDGSVNFGPQDRILSGRYSTTGNRLKIVLDESGRMLEFTFFVRGTAARLVGQGVAFDLRRNDTRQRGGSGDWFYSPDANPEAYGFTWENTWSVGTSSGW